MQLPFLTGVSFCGIVVVSSAAITSMCMKITAWHPYLQQDMTIGVDKGYKIYRQTDFV